VANLVEVQFGAQLLRGTSGANVLRENHAYVPAESMAQSGAATTGVKPFIQHSSERDVVALRRTFARKAASQIQMHAKSGKWGACQSTAKITKMMLGVGTFLQHHASGLAA